MKQINILLVEDSLDDRLLIKRGINKGIESPLIVEAITPLELEEAISNNHFDIVVTDYHLGWTDGIQVLKMVKRNQPQCPVIMMTAVDTEEVAVRAMNAGLDNYIVKSASQFALMGDIIRSALEQRNQAKALVDAESRYQELFESVPIGLFRIQKDGTFLSVNDTFVRMLRYPSKEALLQTNSIELYLHPETRHSNVSQITAENQLHTWEAQLKQHQGETITASISAQARLTADGEILFYEGYVRDITEQVKVEEALSQSEILNETIIASVNDGVVVVDMDLKILTWNRFMEEISGMKQHEVLGLPMVEVFPQNMETTIKDALQKTLNGNTVNIPDAIHLFPISNKQVWLETTFSPLRTSEKRLIGVVANIHDITQRKEDEKEREMLLFSERSLHNATREISALLDLRAIVETTNRLITESTSGNFSGTLILDPENGDMLDLIFFNEPAGTPEDLPDNSEKDKGLIWDHLENLQIHVVDDYPAHPKALPFWLEHGVKSLMAIPLQTSDSLLGIITVFATDPEKRFSQRDQEQALAIGRQAGAAMHKAILYDQTIRRSEELRSLYDIALATGSMLDSNSLLNQLHGNIDYFLHPDSFGIFLYHAETNTFEIANAFKNHGEIQEITGEHYPLKPGGLISEVMLKHKPIRIDNLSEGDKKNILKTFNLPVKSWLGIPLISGDRLIGALALQSMKANAFSDDDQRFLESIAGQVSIALDNAHLYEELENAFVQTVVALANAVDVRDAYTHDHSQRMAIFTTETGKLLGLNKKELENLRWGALLHDIGKIGIPDEILLKPSSLTEEEYEIIKRHPILGASIVSPVKKLESVAPIIRAHQEHFDGNGYPDRLQGDQIPMAARIIAVVDSYVAMTDDRVYRKTLGHQRAVQELIEAAGTQHDPVVVKAFLQVLEKQPELVANTNQNLDQ